MFLRRPDTSGPPGNSNADGRKFSHKNRTKAVALESLGQRGHRPTNVNPLESPKPHVLGKPKLEVQNSCSQ